eukprot:scaffold7765_cov137-Skeletonema_menzelii.AAC.4
MEIAKAILEAVYSKNPPGRFLKKCSETGQWRELSESDAEDRATQALAYAVRCKDELKRNRDDRRRSLRSKSRKKSKVDDHDDVGRKSSKSTDQPTRLQQPTTGQNSESNLSSVTHHGLATHRGGAAATSDDVQSASNRLRVSGNSNPQQQVLLQQLQQSSNISTLPAINNQSLNQHGLTQLLAQTLQQQLPLQLQYTSLVPNPWGQVLQSQTALQPALNEGLTSHLLNQALQQQQQQQLLIQSLLNQQNVPPFASLPTSISLSAPLLTGPQSQSANTNLLLTLQQHSNPASNVLLLGSVLSNNLPHQPTSSAGILFNAPHPYGAQQMGQLLQQQNEQLLASSLGASSNVQLPFQQQQMQPLDPLLQQALQARLPVQLRQQLQLQSLPPPRINNSISANVAARPTRQEESKDEEQNEPGDDSGGD